MCPKIFNFATYYYKAHTMTPEEKARVKMHSGPCCAYDWAWTML